MFDEQNELVQQQPEQVQQDVQQPQENAKEYNFNMMRERHEEERRRREDAERRAAQYEQYILEQQRNMSRRQEEPEIQVGDEDYVSGAQLKQFIKRVETYSKSAIEQTEKKYQEKLQEIEQKNAVKSLKANFKDFSTVVNDATINKFAAEYPSIFASIRSNPDVYERGEALYTTIKQFTPNTTKTDTYYNTNRTQNQAPRPAAGLGSAPSASPLVNLNSGDRRVLTPEEKEAVRRRLQETKSRSL